MKNPSSLPLLNYSAVNSSQRGGAALLVGLSLHGFFKLKPRGLLLPFLLKGLRINQAVIQPSCTSRSSSLSGESAVGNTVMS